MSGKEKAAKASRSAASELAEKVLCIFWADVPKTNHTKPPMLRDPHSCRWTLLFREVPILKALVLWQSWMRRTLEEVTWESLELEKQTRIESWAHRH